MGDNAALLLERFNRSWKGIDRVYHEIARRSGLSDCAFWILYGLEDADGPVPQNDLSQVWLYSRQTVSSALRQLEDRGLIHVDYASGSKRDKQISLTDEGTQFTATYIDPAMAAEKQALTALGKDDSDTLMRLIDRYTGLLNNAVESQCSSLPPVAEWTFDASHTQCNGIAADPDDNESNNDSCSEVAPPEPAQPESKQSESKQSESDVSE